MQIRRPEEKIQMPKPPKTEIQLLTEKVTQLERKVDRLIKSMTAKSS